MIELCCVKTQPFTGRQGQQKTERTVIAVDSMNLILGVDRGYGCIEGLGYFQRFSHMQGLLRECGIKPEEVVPLLSSSLNQKLNRVHCSTSLDQIDMFFESWKRTEDGQALLILYKRLEEAQKACLT